MTSPFFLHHMTREVPGKLLQFEIILVAIFKNSCHFPHLTCHIVNKCQQHCQNFNFYNVIWQAKHQTAYLWLSEYSTLYIQTNILGSGCHFKNDGHVESGDSFFILHLVTPKL